MKKVHAGSLSDLEMENTLWCPAQVSDVCQDLQLLTGRQRGTCPQVGKETLDESTQTLIFQSLWQSPIILPQTNQQGMEQIGRQQGWWKAGWTIKCKQQWSAVSLKGQNWHQCSLGSLLMPKGKRAEHTQEVHGCYWNREQNFGRQNCCSEGSHQRSGVVGASKSTTKAKVKSCLWDKQPHATGQAVELPGVLPPVLLIMKGIPEIQTPTGGKEEIILHCDHLITSQWKRLTGNPKDNKHVFNSSQPRPEQSWSETLMTCGTAELAPSLARVRVRTKPHSATDTHW